MQEGAMETSNIAHKSLTNGIYSFKYISAAAVGLEIENTTPDQKPIAYTLAITNLNNVRFISLNETTVDEANTLSTTPCFTFEGWLLPQSKEEIVKVEAIDPKSPWSFDHKLTWEPGNIQNFVSVRERQMAVSVAQMKTKAKELFPEGIPAKAHSHDSLSNR